MMIALAVVSAELLSLSQPPTAAVDSGGHAPTLPTYRQQLEPCLVQAEGSYGYASCYRTAIDAAQAEVDARHARMINANQGREARIQSKAAQTRDARKRRKAAKADIAAFRAYQAGACADIYLRGDQEGTILSFMIGPRCDLHVLEQRIAHLDWIDEAYRSYAGEIID